MILVFLPFQRQILKYDEIMTKREIASSTMKKNGINYVFLSFPCLFLPFHILIGDKYFHQILLVQQIACKYYVGVGIRILMSVSSGLFRPFSIPRWDGHTSRGMQWMERCLLPAIVGSFTLTFRSWKYFTLFLPLFRA